MAVEIFSTNTSAFEFLKKTYEIVDDPSTDSVISKGQNGRSFIVWNTEAFARNLLRRHLVPTTDFKNFARRLKIYGLEKVDGSEHQWEFANQDFVRGQPELVKNISDRCMERQKSFSDLHLKPRFDRLISTGGSYEEIISLMKEQRQARERQRMDTALANDLARQCNL